jgi:hypothetical protein
MAPFSWNGANFLYTKFISPFVLKHEKEVDSYLKSGAAMADAMAEDMTAKGSFLFAK